MKAVVRDKPQEEPMRILLVEDEPATGEAVKIGLTFHGLTITWVQGAEEAVELFQQGGFDAILSDIRLGKMSGIDLLHKVRKIDAEFPFILMTAYTDLDPAAQAIKLGAHDFILKPVRSMDLLIRPIRKAVEGYRLRVRNRVLQEALEKSEYRLKSFLSSMVDCVFVLDADGRLAFLHLPVECAFVQAAGESAIGRPCSEVLPAHVAPLFSNAVEKSRDGQAIEFEFAVPHGKSNRYYAVKASPIVVDRAFSGSVAVVREVTERRRTEEELKTHQDRLRNLTAELAFKEDKERRRIAEDLHDSIGLMICMAKDRLTVVGRALKTAEKSVRRPLDEVVEWLDQALKEIRSLTFELSPPALELLGLPDAIGGFLRRLEQVYGIRTTLKTRGDCSAMEDRTAFLLYRSVRELLFNAAHHGRPARIDVTVMVSGDGLQIEVRDNGTGFDVDRDRCKGTGLSGISERMQSLGGRLDIQSVPGKGTVSTLTVPWTKE